MSGTPTLRFEEKARKSYQRRRPRRDQAWHFPRKLYYPFTFNGDGEDVGLLDYDAVAPASLSLEEAQRFGEECGTYYQPAMLKTHCWMYQIQKRGKPGGRRGRKSEPTDKVERSLSFRLPREKGGLIAPKGDGLAPFERAMVLLGTRARAKKTHYTLDGRPCSAFDILDAARVTATNNAQTIKGTTV